MDSKDSVRAWLHPQRSIMAGEYSRAKQPDSQCQEAEQESNAGEERVKDLM